MCEAETVFPDLREKKNAVCRTSLTMHAIPSPPPLHKTQQSQAEAFLIDNTPSGKNSHLILAWDGDGAPVLLLGIPFPLSYMRSVIADISEAEQDG